MLVHAAGLSAAPMPGYTTFRGLSHQVLQTVRSPLPTSLCELNTARPLALLCSSSQGRARVLSWLVLSGLGCHYRLAPSHAAVLAQALTAPGVPAMLDMFGNRVRIPQPCAAAPLTDATAPPPPEKLPCGASPVQPAAVPLAEGRQDWPVWVGVSAAGPADWEGLGPLATRPTALALACADALMADALSTSYVDAAAAMAADAQGRAASSIPAHAAGQARRASPPFSRGSLFLIFAFTLSTFYLPSLICLLVTWATSAILIVTVLLPGFDMVEAVAAWLC